MVQKVLILVSWLFLVLANVLALAFCLKSWITPQFQIAATQLMQGRGLAFHVLFVIILFASVGPAAHSAKLLWTDESSAKSHERLAAVMNVLFLPLFILSAFSVPFLAMLDMKYATGTTSYISVLFFITCVIPQIIFSLIFLGPFAIMTARMMPPLYLLLVFGPFAVAYWIALYSA